MLYNIICVVAIVIISIRCRIVFVSHVDDTLLFHLRSRSSVSSFYCAVSSSSPSSSSLSQFWSQPAMQNIQSGKDLQFYHARGCRVTTDTRLFRRFFFYFCYCYGFSETTFFFFSFVFPWPVSAPVPCVADIYLISIYTLNLPH